MIPSQKSVTAKAVRKIKFQLSLDLFSLCINTPFYKFQRRLMKCFGIAIFGQDLWTKAGYPEKFEQI
jgi:hypothetical protein